MKTKRNLIKLFVVLSLGLMFTVMVSLPVKSANCDCIVVGWYQGGEEWDTLECWDGCGHFLHLLTECITGEPGECVNFDCTGEDCVVIYP